MGTNADDFEDIILEPLPPQDRSTPAGRAMLSLAHLVGRILNASGAVLLFIAAGTNFAVTFLALLLHRAGGRATLPLIAVAISWVLWVGLAYARGQAARPARPGGGGAEPAATGSSLQSAPQPAATSLRAKNATVEYLMRRKTFLPRVEAAQRAAKTLVGGPEEPAWLARDIRPLVALFVAVAVSIPIMMILAIITVISLLTTSSPI